MFFLVPTGRDHRPTLVGIANIATIKQDEGQQLTFTMISGETIRTSVMDFDELAEMLPQRKIMVVNLQTISDRAKKRAEEEAPALALPIETMANNTSPSADPLTATQQGT